ncbi:HD domain-containing protein [Mesorhizobium sp. B3-1-3]|uniref:HD domain-containing protein n=1 Tax=unclassified Mesorhizobium TaxID=325217 RepID=UPI00112E07FD|nr:MULTISPECIES: HD domain-containing protein [unclassified Mesorhizobium]TPI65599.1 HD domain-containing protein [Mesorhizobium sp. B3-1-3]TPI67222.1 HD domain-containing protein [Mesorhizobium sp. B3-1-8]
MAIDTQNASADLRRGVLEDLPELDLIGDATLREQAIDAWVLSLSQSSFRRIRDMPGEAVPGTLILKEGGQDLHLRGVTLVALGMADYFINAFASARIDRDILIAGGLCHDIGKTFECDPENQRRWNADASHAGRPSLRHPIFGAHICLTAGLPESVAHIAACHSAEGDNVQRSLECTIIREADAAWWRVATGAGLVKPETVTAEFERMYAQRAPR